MEFDVLAQKNGRLGERVFFTKDVSLMAGISLRQLQWWDEHKVVSPQRQLHRRVYSSQQLLEILIIASFRRKGMALKSAKVVLRHLRRQLGQERDQELAQTTRYVLTDGKSVHLESRPERVLNRLTEAKTGMFLVCLSDLILSMTSKKAPRRYLTKQLRLF